MNDINLKDLDAIKADQQLIEATKAKVLRSSRRKTGIRLKRLAAAACLAVLLGSATLYYLADNQEARLADVGVVRMDDGSLKIPAIKLPENSGGGQIMMDMIGLIVYQGKIYTQTSTAIDPANAKNLVGDKLGRTRGNLDEWSKPGDYTEFASTIGVQDVFGVKGYDPDFRIMTYQEHDDGAYAEFYECLNGVVISSGQDIIGKLNIAGNITSAKYQKHSDWNYSTGVFSSVENIDLLEEAIENLNAAAPMYFDDSSAMVDEYWNDTQYRRLLITLNDGSEVSLTVLKTGLVFYGYSWVGFEVDSDVFGKLWTELGGK